MTVGQKALLYYGALLHDVGKVVYRGMSERGSHSKLGADFIRNEVAPRNEAFDGAAGKAIVEQIRYHHADEIVSASGLANDSLAFVTYFADNVSAGMDRKNEGDEAQAQYFDRSVDLRKIFNILNGRHDDGKVPHKDYNAIREDIKRGLVGAEVSLEGVNSLLNLLEATTSAVPSSTNRAQLVDVSLYDHAKTTAGIAACMYDYLVEQGVGDYRAALFDKGTSARYHGAPMFLLYSCDMSGIQDFIYNISGSGALKQLRARSMYLELLLEDIADELLEGLGLTRANLLYTGGGHAYLLLPNTAQVKARLAEFEADLRAWFLANYRTDLYLASAWVECCSDDLANRGDDKRRYPDLYRRLSRKLSEAKASRYDAGVLRGLNFAPTAPFDHSRECSECHRSDLSVNAEGKCPLCAALGRISPQLVTKDVFVVEPCEEDAPDGLALPFGRQLVMYSRAEYERVKPARVRVYTKNSWDMGEVLATHIWMGDYTGGEKGLGFAGYEGDGVTLDEGVGIERLGVLRADVDNLGAAFVSGLPADKTSISRTSTLSRSLSYFFKYQINEVLAAGGSACGSACGAAVGGAAGGAAPGKGRDGKRGYQVQIIYSGGDDLFIVGNWSDVLFAAADIRKAFDEYTGNGSLTLSAGIGMFDAKYPIARMAQETGELEDAAKMYVAPDRPGRTKNALALWTEGAVFGWDEFCDVVMPRFEEMRELFRKPDAGEDGPAPDADDKGKAFIYKLVELLRSYNDVSSAPRLAYLLARAFEGNPNGAQIGKRFYSLARDERERRCLVAALEWYIYSTRERG